MLRAAGATVDDSAPDVWPVEPGPLRGRDLDDRARPVRRRAVLRRRAGHRRRGHAAGLAAAAATQPVDRLRELLTAMGGEVPWTPAG